MELKYNELETDLINNISKNYLEVFKDIFEKAFELNFYENCDPLSDNDCDYDYFNIFLLIFEHT